MSHRLTSIALAALVCGITILVLADGGVANVVGLAMIVPGAALTTVALVRHEPSGRDATADDVSRRPGRRAPR